MGRSRIVAEFALAILRTQKSFPRTNEPGCLPRMPIRELLHDLRTSDHD